MTIGNRNAKQEAVRFMLSTRGMDVVTAALTCIAFLAIAGLAASRGRVEPLAARFAVLCIVLFAYDAFELFATISVRPEWVRDWFALANAAASLITPVFYHYVVAFLGQRRHRSPSVVVCYAYFGAIALTCLRPSLLPHIGPFVGSGVWAVLMLVGIAQFASSGVVLLVRHARRSATDERARAALVTAAVVVATCGNAADLVTMASTIKLPSVGPWALVASALVLGAATLRSKLLARVSVLVALNAGAVALAVVFGEIVLFRWLGGRTALLAAGSMVIAIAALGAGRYLLSAVSEHRERMLMHATLGRMSQQMAHDLRNPLGIIKGHAQALQVDLEQGRTIDARALEPIIQHVDRMSRTIDDYRRIGRVEPQLRQIDVNTVVSDAVNGDPQTRKELGVNLPRCMADPDLLLIAVENVLRNAREAGECAISIRTELARNAVTITIADTGPGMDPRTRERVFEDFFTTKATGSGLGLSFVRRVMDAHGGHVTLESAIGKGTRVMLELPIDGE